MNKSAIILIIAIISLVYTATAAITWDQAGLDAININLTGCCSATGLNDTNESVRFDFLTSVDCAAGQVVKGINTTGGVLCVEDTDTTIPDTDTNETPRFDMLVGTNCTVGDYVYGVNSSGGVICDTPSGGGDTNASTACSGDENYLSGDGNCIDVNNTIDTRIASTTYLPYNTTIISGTYVDGNDSSVNVSKDGLSYNITEVTGAGPLTVVINFSDVSNFNQLILRLWYEDSSHEIAIGLYDYGDSDYEEEYGTIQSMPGFEIISRNVLDPADHISGGGEVSLRLRHIQNGIATHQLRIDYAALVEGFTTISTDEHDALSGRNEIDNHPWAMPTNASRNFTGNVVIESPYNLTVQGHLIINNLTTSEDIIPALHNIYSLGNSTRWFKELYVTDIYNDNLYGNFVNTSELNSTNINSEDVNSSTVHVDDNLTLGGFKIIRQDTNLAVILT